jgi:DNA-binding transcriptional LysR family regulator
MPDITLQQIETFLTVAEHLNFSEAAKAMYISQPALSKTILRLENGIGTTLFVRKSHGVELTSEGEYLYCELKPLYHRVCKAFNEVNHMHATPSRILRMACHTSFELTDTSSVFRLKLIEYKEKYPDVTVIEELFEFKELRSALVSGDADIVYTASFALGNLNDISIRNIEEHIFCIAMSSKHPLASCKTLPVGELNREDFYFVSPSYATNHYERCSQIGFTPKNMILLHTFPSVMMAVRQGKGMTRCGYNKSIAEGNEIRFFPIPEIPNPPYMAVAWRTNDLSKEARDFIDLLP